MGRPAEEHLLSIVDQAYDAILEPDRWNSLIDNLATLYSGTAAITSQSMLGANARIHAVSGLDPAFQRSYEAYYSEKRPWTQKVDTLLPGELMTVGCLIEQAAYERCEYFNDWLRPQGIYHLFSVPLVRDESGSTYLTISRSRKRGEFDRAELELSRKLIPHLRRAVMLRQHLYAVTRQNELTARSLDALQVGAILVSQDGAIQFANGMAETILKRGDALIANNGRLRAHTPADTKALYGLIRPGTSGRVTGGILAIERSNRSPLHVLVCPAPTNGLEVGYSDGALVLASEATQDVAIRPADLIKLYGLTGAEANLMVALASGKTLDEFADANGVRRTTLRTHLRSIFDKTGWRRQSELVRGALADTVLQMAARLVVLELPMRAASHLADQTPKQSCVRPNGYARPRMQSDTVSLDRSSE